MRRRVCFGHFSLSFSCLSYYPLCPGTCYLLNAQSCQITLYYKYHSGDPINVYKRNEWKPNRAGIIIYILWRWKLSSRTVNCWCMQFISCRTRPSVHSDLLQSISLPPSLHSFPFDFFPEPSPTKVQYNTFFPSFFFLFPSPFWCLYQNVSTLSLLKELSLESRRK